LTLTRLTRLTANALFVVVLLSLVAACSNPIGSRTSTGSSRPPAAALPAAVQSNSAPAASTSIEADPQADDIEQSLTDVNQQLNSIDALDDLK
jgi:hypothetical protein